MFCLAWFRDRGSIARLGAGFGLSQATAYRYLGEVIDVLAEQAPGLREALEMALAEGTPYVILDGKVVDTDRCHERPPGTRSSGPCGAWENAASRFAAVYPQLAAHEVQTTRQIPIVILPRR